MKDKLLQAKKLVREGKIKEALDLMKSVSETLKGYIGKCPECGQPAPATQDMAKMSAECVKCGATWQKNIHSKLLKLDGRDTMILKKDIVAKLWELHQAQDPDVTPFDINHFEATGWLKKSLAVKLGLPIPGEKTDEELAKAKYSPAAQDKIGELIGDLKRDKGYSQDRAVAAAMNIARRKGYKVPAKKSETVSPENFLSKSDVLDILLQMVKKGEEATIVNRHTISKFEATGEITNEAMEAVYKKAGKDWNDLKKQLEAEDKSLEKAIPPEVQARIDAKKKGEVKKEACDMTKECKKCGKVCKCSLAMKSLDESRDRGIFKAFGIDTAWTGSKAAHVSEHGNHGQVPYSELAMHTRHAGKQIKRYSLFNNDKGHTTWAHVETDQGVLDGLPAEVLPFHVQRRHGLYKSIMPELKLSERAEEILKAEPPKFKVGEVVHVHDRTKINAPKDSKEVKITAVRSGGGPMVHDQFGTDKAGLEHIYEVEHPIHGKLHISEKDLLPKPVEKTMTGKEALPAEMEGKEELKDKTTGPLKPKVEKKK